MASSEHPFPNEIPSRHPLPSGFQLTPDARSTTLPVTPVIPPTVANGDVITSLHENQTVAALGDLWTNEQWLAAQSLSDPTSAKGDLLARGASALARLAVGAAGQVLTVDAAAPLGVKWAAQTGGGAVSSVFTRTGAVVAASGDYTAAQVTNAVSVLGAYADPAWITSLAYAKITGAPAAGVPTSRQVIAGAGLSGGGALTADVTLTALGMVASGASHRAGIVPDPGATGGAARYLREDATWAIPAGAGGGLTDPTTTLGDLIVRGAAAPTRLGVGTNGQALLADSAAPLGVKWGAVSGGGSQTPWTSDINAANFNLNRVQGIGIGAIQDAAANFGVFISHASIFDAFKQINSSATGWAGFSLQNDLGHTFAFRVYGSGRSPSDVAALESSIPMTFFTGAVERMRITAAGLVGIGKTPATYKLEVSGDVDITGGVYRVNGVPISTSQTPWTSNINAAGFFLNSVGQINIASTAGVGMIIDAPAGSAAQMAFASSGLSKWYVGHENFGNFYLYNDPAGAVLRVLNTGAVADTIVLSGGNVGLGLTPTYRLQLSTDSAAKPTTSAWTVASDARVKRNVRDLAGGLEIIRRLRPIEAEYNGLAGTPAGARVVSFLAQEIREVLPHTVGSVRRKLSPKDAAETDILDFNIHEVLMHLVLAVKQLAAMRPSDGN